MRGSSSVNTVLRLEVWAGDEGFELDKYVNTMIPNNLLVYHLLEENFELIAIVFQYFFGAAYLQKLGWKYHCSFIRDPCMVVLN